MVVFADATTADNLLNEPLHDLKQGLVMKSSSKQLAVIEDLVIEGNKTFIDVFLNAVDAGHVEGSPVLTRPVPLFQQVSAMHVCRCLAPGVVEDSIELTDGNEVNVTTNPLRVKGQEC